jgi:hypothetical protein
VEPEQLTSLVPEGPRIILVGESVQLRPIDGEMFTLRVMFPVKPLSEVTVTFDVAVAPELAVTLVGLAAKAKS